MDKSNKIESKISISVEGVKLPNKPLTNFQLIDTIKQLLKIPHFRGVFMRNDLPRRPLKRECGILNLDGVSGRGTHWVCWYKNNDNIYFDSFGVEPLNELIEYLSSPIFYNTEKIQPDGEVICGHLCLYVLYRLSRGEGFQEIINDLY